MQHKGMTYLIRRGAGSLRRLCARRLTFNLGGEGPAQCACHSKGRSVDYWSGKNGAVQPVHFLSETGQEVDRSFANDRLNRKRSQAGCLGIENDPRDFARAVG